MSKPRPENNAPTLLGLPAEIRIMIYDLVLANENGDDEIRILRRVWELAVNKFEYVFIRDGFTEEGLTSHFADQIVPTDLLRVNIQIHDEALSVFYNANIFHHSINSHFHNIPRLAMTGIHFSLLKRMTLDICFPVPSLGPRQKWMPAEGDMDHGCDHFVLQYFVKALLKHAPHLQILVVFVLPTASKDSLNSRLPHSSWMGDEEKAILRQMIKRLCLFTYITWGFKWNLEFEMRSILPVHYWETKLWPSPPGLGLTQRQKTFVVDSLALFKRRQLETSQEFPQFWSFTTGKRCLRAIEARATGDGASEAQNFFSHDCRL